MPACLQFSSLQAPFALGPPACPQPWLLWLREANVMLAPWTALLALAMPLPYRLAVPLHLEVATVNVAATGWRRRLSLALCAESGEHYVAAVQWTTAWMGPPGSSTAELPPSPAAAYWLLHATVHALTAALVLTLLHHTERRKRQAFARQQAEPALRRTGATHGCCSTGGSRASVADLVACGLLWVCSLVVLCPRSTR